MSAFFFFFFFNDPATTEIYTLSLHDALPISPPWPPPVQASLGSRAARRNPTARSETDRKSTRLNSSHRTISYAVFCLKKKKKNRKPDNDTQKNQKDNTRTDSKTKNRIQKLQT